MRFQYGEMNACDEEHSPARILGASPQDIGNVPPLRELTQRQDGIGSLRLFNGEG
jgi:hypothetical protein